MRENPDDLLAPSDAARVLGISVDQVRQLSDKGTLPTLKTVGGRRLFKRADVVRILEARRAA